MSAFAIDYANYSDMVENFSNYALINLGQSDALKSYQAEFGNLLAEMGELTGSIEEDFEQNALNEEKSLLLKRQIVNTHTQEALIAGHNDELESERSSILANEAKVNEWVEVLAKSREQNRRHQTHESQMNLLRNDYEIVNEIEMTQTKVLSSSKTWSDPKQSLESLEKYQISMFLLGINIMDKARSQNELKNENADEEMICEMEAKMSVSHKSGDEIWFTNLPDDCLYSEKNFEHLSQMPEVKKRMMDLSPGLLDNYRMIFKKRKQRLQNEKFKKEKTNQPIGGCVIVDNLKDFKIINSNFEKLLCNILTKHEIEEAMRTFAIDWIEGSQILTILINSKSSKIATVVMPKFYPLCGTSMIKLISLTGYDDNVAKKFKIATDLESLSEWIAQFTELYNNNQIVVADAKSQAPQ